MSFTRMDDSTRAEWLAIGKATMDLQPEVPKRIMSMLRELEHVRGGFGVHQLHHALQTATMARRANASDELVLIALCHDIGKVISIPNHAAIAAEIVRPYVSKDAYEILRTHQLFQGRHYFQHFGASQTLRDEFRNESWFAQAEQFTDEWDQAAFDPNYAVLPLAEFEPLVQQFFSRFPLAL